MNPKRIKYQARTTNRPFTRPRGSYLRWDYTEIFYKTYVKIYQKRFLQHRRTFCGKNGSSLGFEESANADRKIMEHCNYLRFIDMEKITLITQALSSHPNTLLLKSFTCFSRDVLGIENSPQFPWVMRYRFTVNNSSDTLPNCCLLQIIENSIAQSFFRLYSGVSIQDYLECHSRFPYCLFSDARKDGRVKMESKSIAPIDKRRKSRRSFTFSYFPTYAE